MLAPGLSSPLRMKRAAKVHCATGAGARQSRRGATRCRTCPTLPRDRRTLMRERPSPCATATGARRPRTMPRPVLRYSLRPLVDDEPDSLPPPDVPELLPLDAPYVPDVPLLLVPVPVPDVEWLVVPV